MLKGKCLSVTFDFKDSWLLKQCFCLSYHPLRCDKQLEPFLFTLRCSKICVQSAAKKVFFQMILRLPTGKRRHEIGAEPDGLAFSAFGYECDTAHSELSGVQGASLHVHHHHSSLKEPLSYHSQSNPSTCLSGYSFHLYFFFKRSLPIGKMHYFFLILFLFFNFYLFFLILTGTCNSFKDISYSVSKVDAKP